MIREKDQIGYGVLSLVIGVVSLLLIYFDVYFMHRFLFLVIFYLPLSVLSMIFGLMSYWGDSRDKFVGLVGIIVGFLIIPFSLVWVILS